MICQSMRKVCPVLMAALALVAGCGLEPKSYDSRYGSASAGFDVDTLGGERDMDARMRRPAPAPEPRAEAPARPAPAPVPAGECRPAVAANQIASSLAFPTGDERSSALLVTQVMPREVRAGAEYEYELHVCNLTTAVLQNVSVTAGGFQNLSIVSTNPATSSTAGGNATWNVGDLGARSTTVIRVRAKAANVGTSAACVSASYNNTLCLATNVTQPALAITKTQTPEVVICDPINIQLTVRNTGTGVAENVVLRDQLPAGLTVDGKQTVEIPAGTLAAGESKVFNLVAKAGKTGKFENNATAASAGGLSAQSQTVSTIVRQPVLAIACRAPERVFIGRPVTVEWQVKNSGDAPCAATVTVPLPAGATFQSATQGGTAGPQGVTWNLGSLPAGETKTIALTFNPTAMTSYAFTATANCPCANSVNTTCQTVVEGIPAMLLNGSDDPDPVQVGQTVTYTLTVTNQGSAPLTNIRLVGTMEDSMEFVGDTGPGKATVNGLTVTFPAVARLDAQQRITYTVVVRAKKAGQVQFRAEAVSNEITRPLIKTETTNFYQ